MTLRDAVPEDATAVATLHVRAYRAAYRGMFPDEILDALQPQDRMERYQFDALGSSRSTIVACLGGLVRGFVTVGPSRDADLSGHGEIYALYVDPAEWGCGIGTRLIEHARALLASEGFAKIFLWAIAENERAERFYRRDGWVRDSASCDKQILGHSVVAVRYQRDVSGGRKQPSGQKPCA